MEIKNLFSYLKSHIHKHIDIHSNVIKAPILDAKRFRWHMDGPGINTLVTMNCCPLKCAYCITNSCHIPNDHLMTPRELYDYVKEDELYFLATDSGIVFTGGEPCEYVDFITEFRRICGPQWQIICQTSLNVEPEKISKLIPIVDYWVVDIKDLNTAIYTKYTGQNNSFVFTNLKELKNKNKCHRTRIRIPLIPKFNDESDVEKSKKYLSKLGFYIFDTFTYIEKRGDYIDVERLDEQPELGKSRCEYLRDIRKEIIELYGLDPSIIQPCTKETCDMWHCEQCSKEMQLIRELIGESALPTFKEKLEKQRKLKKAAIERANPNPFRIWGGPRTMGLYAEPRPNSSFPDEDEEI